MDKEIFYKYCREKRAKNEDWTKIYLHAKRDDIVGTKTSYSEFIELYQQIAGEISAFGTTKQTKFDDDLAAFYKWLGKSRSIERQKEKVKSDSNITRTLVVSDVHIPYHNQELLRRAVDAEKGKSNALVILGDFLNGTSLSDHAKLSVEDFREEMKQGRMQLELLSAEFDEVWITDDNHVHSRAERMLGFKIPPDLHFLFNHPYDLLCAGLPNVRRSSELTALRTKYHKEFGWLHILGEDCVMAHGEVSGMDFAAVRKVQKFANNWKRHLGIKEVRCVVEAHTHQTGQYHDDDCLLMYSGCLVDLEGITYSMSAKACGGPPRNGYCVIVQENGRTNLEESFSKRLVL